ncbi:MAG: tRNA (adenosine(37)-N6)-threonylcarbamoyltransferase complex dimerization subunit type 1 TsaB [Candidatus Kapabacteria bacterium]|nr:tRNA (adenosine(37)-N6)-threonylcarbamoyltransferase complex dimerization subunit type 1 TsaB [Candidatus Kapabacteria bacterium]
MTRLLAIETSGTVCSVAVAIDGSLVSSIEILHSNVHDAMLTRCVRDVVENATLHISDIDVVAVSSGPGSFTGLRIGAAFVKGLCFSGSPTLLAVPTLTALLHAGTEVATIGGFESITAVVSSHRDLVYCATSPTSDATHTPHIELLSKESVLQRISDRTMVVGPAAAMFVPNPVSGLTRLSARFVAFAAWRLLAAGAPFTDAMTFVPDYRQDFVPKS